MLLSGNRQDNFNNHQHDSLFLACKMFETGLMKRFEIQPYIIPDDVDLPYSLLEEMLMKTETVDKTNKSCKEESSAQLETQLQSIEDKTKKNYFFISTKKIVSAPPLISYSMKKRVNLRSDSMKKRIKAIVNNYIFTKLSSLIKSEGSQIFFFALPSYFTNNLNLYVNRKMLSMTIKEIYSYFLPKFSEKDLIRTKHNINMINKVSTKDLHNQLGKTWKEMYLEYITTDEYKCYLDNILMLDGQAYYIHFKKQIDKFISYFEGSTRF